MAILKDNIVFRGLSGRFGDAVFKVLRGKTIVTKPSRKSTSYSELQQGTRTKFKEASAFAKAAMLDAERKVYYQKKAVKLKLPNAYTAALTDYMRKPVVEQIHLDDKPVMLEVVKKDFNITKVIIRNNEGVIKEANPEDCKVANRWFIEFKREETLQPVTILMEDETGQLHVRVYTFINL